MEVEDVGTRVDNAKNQPDAINGKNVQANDFCNGDGNQWQVCSFVVLTLKIRAFSSANTTLEHPL
jgi:hypothetical protein